LTIIYRVSSQREAILILPGLPSVKGKPVHVAFDGGRMTSDAGILLLAAIEQRLGIAARLPIVSKIRVIRTGFCTGLPR